MQNNLATRLASQVKKEMLRSFGKRKYPALRQYRSIINWIYSTFNNLYNKYMKYEDNCKVRQASQVHMFYLYHFIIYFNVRSH